MQEFELQAPPELLYSLNRMVRTTRKYHSRMFLNNLKSFVLRSLLSQQTRGQPQEEDSLEMQFVGMCAQKIQAVFRGYIVRKYHLKVKARLDKLKQKWSGVVLGWKTRQVFRSCKIVESAKVIKSKRKQLSGQEDRAGECPSQYSIRKLEYLRQSLREEIQQFIHKFNYLLQNEVWIFEPKIPKKPASRTSKRPVQTAQPIQSKPQHEAKVTEQTVEREKPKRVREMRQRATRTSKTVVEDKPVDSNSEHSQVFPLESGEMGSSLEDRPIKAKGAYVLEENMAIQPAPEEQPRKVQEKKEDDEDKFKAKRIDKARMEKRQKYDPKKAIEEEKKRKKEQKKIVPEEVPTKQTKEEPEPKNKSQDKAKESAEGEVIEGTATRSTVAYSKGSKAKVEPKIDCWAHRKTNRGAPEQHRTTYRTIHSKDQEIAKNIQKIKREINPDKSPIKTISKSKEKQPVQSQEEEPRHQQRGRSGGQQSSPAGKREGHKCIEEIESVYNNVYQGRLQRLLPKLSLLAAAREKESFGSIPVVSHESSLLRRKLSENSFNSRFWWTASRLQKTFKEFDLS